MPTREDAWKLLCEYTASESLRKHALAVEACVRAYARKSGADEDLWSVTALLHDFDYERFPTEQDHVWRGMEILRQRGWPEAIVRAVASHAFYTNVARATPMEKGILAADERTGFVGACALGRPSKRVADLPVESVLKRMREKAFARSVDRSYIVKGAEEWGLPLPELAALVIKAQIPIADRLGLGGAPAPDLPDAPPPPEPPAG